jgi:hypothetical protein
MRAPLFEAFGERVSRLSPSGRHRTAPRPSVGPELLVKFEVKRPMRKIIKEMGHPKPMSAHGWSPFWSGLLLATFLLGTMPAGAGLSDPSQAVEAASCRGLSSAQCLQVTRAAASWTEE